MNIRSTIDITIRSIVFILAITIGVMFVVCGARAALAASLKPTAMIDADVFTVGDIFDGLSKEISGKILGPAPKPGQDITLNAHTLMRVAIALDVPWRPHNATESITLKRAANVIDTTMIKDALSEKIREVSIEGAFDISFLSNDAPSMIIPIEQDAALEIGQFHLDPKTQRFSATIYTPSKSKALKSMNIAGKIERLTSVPVLMNPMSRGTIISASDIDWIEMKSAQLHNGQIIDAEQLIGMTPRRSVSAGTPLRDIDILKPQIISRGDVITISYESGPLTLTAKGKALRNGARGDIIPVTNMASNRTVQAEIDDESLVRVIQ